MYRCDVKRGAIVAAAGRRIDPWDATVPRFPSSAVRETRRRIDDTLVRHKAIALVTSAACGADLLALSSAADLRLRRRVVLPFAPELFRKTSVTDRPGEWGPVFDETLLQLQAAGDVLILDGSPDDDGYTAVGEAPGDGATRVRDDRPFCRQRRGPRRPDRLQSPRASVVVHGCADRRRPVIRQRNVRDTTSV